IDRQSQPCWWPCVCNSGQGSAQMLASASCCCLGSQPAREADSLGRKGRRKKLEKGRGPELRRASFERATGSEIGTNRVKKVNDNRVKCATQMRFKSLEIRLISVAISRQAKTYAYPN